MEHSKVRMHSHLKYALVYFLVFCTVGIGSPHDNYLGPDQIQVLSADTTIAECEEEIRDLKSDPNWLEHLYDPILITNEQVRNKISQYKNIYQCLGNQSEPLTMEQELIYALTGYFLIFVDGLYSNPEGREFYLVDLASVDDPAIERMRRELDIPPPRGYVFVNLFNSRNDMPGPIGEAFQNNNVAGVTMFTRYIAVLDETKSTWYETALRNQSLPATISHELVHSYVNSSVGWEQISDLPSWFHEGIAIYYSNSGENRAVVTPNFTLRTTPPPEYRQYDLNFKFLEVMYGESSLQEKISRAISMADHRVLLEDLQINNADELARSAIEWQQNRYQLRIFAGLIILVGSAYLIISGNYAKIPVPASRCQACGRFYWLWDKSQLHSYSPPRRTWIDGNLGSEYPFSIHAHKLCQACAKSSDEIWRNYQSRIQHEIEISYNKAKKVYRKWLMDAPQISTPLKNGDEELDFTNALEVFINASLLSVYSHVWLPSSIKYEFTQRIYHLCEDLIHNPPGTYINVLKAIVTSPHHHEQNTTGSIYKTSGGRIVIVWNLMQKSG